MPTCWAGAADAPDTTRFIWLAREPWLDSDSAERFVRDRFIDVWDCWSSACNISSLVRLLRLLGLLDWLRFGLFCWPCGAPFTAFMAFESSPPGERLFCESGFCPGNCLG